MGSSYENLHQRKLPAIQYGINRKRRSRMLVTSANNFLYTQTLVGHIPIYSLDEYIPNIS